jgi:hypothetical protein
MNGKLILDNGLEIEIENFSILDDIHTGRVTKLPSDMSSMAGVALDYIEHYLEEEKKVHTDRYPDVNKEKFWINHTECNFYDKDADKKCLVYGYDKCCRTRASKCKYAKMQAMEKKKAMADSINFRWHKKDGYGTIEFKEGYTEYANVKLDVEKHEFDYLYQIFKRKSEMLNEYYGTIACNSVYYYEQDY